VIDHLQLDLTGPDVNRRPQPPQRFLPERFGEPRPDRLLNDAPHYPMDLVKRYFTGQEAEAVSA